MENQVMEYASGNEMAALAIKQIGYDLMGYYPITPSTQIAEGLSQVAVTEIIGVVLAYCIKSVVENLSKNNHWPDKSPWVGGEPPEDEDGRG